MNLKVDRVLVYKLELTETEKLELCSELSENVDHNQFPALASLFNVISDVQVAFRP